MKIPRVISQTAPNWETLSPKIRENIDQIRNLNPEWKYDFYSDSDVLDFVTTNFDNYIKQTFLSINPKYGAARADLFRYLVVYQTGGLYLDIKSGAINKLDSIINPTDRFIYSQWDQLLHPNWGNKGELTIPEAQNWFIFAERNSPLLEKVIVDICEAVRCYKPIRDGVGRRGILRLTGPIIYTKSLLGNPEFKNATFKSNQELGFVYSIYGNSLEHRTENAMHYSSLREPIVLTNCVKFNVITYLFRIAYGIKSLFRI